MKYKIWFDEESGMLKSEIYETFDAETSSSFFDEMLNNYTPDQQRYCLISLGNNAQDMIDKETRRISKEKGSNLKWEKIAVYGAKPVLRMLAKIILKAIGKAKDTQFFETEEEAFAWLKAEMNVEKVVQPEE